MIPTAGLKRLQVFEMSYDGISSISSQVVKQVMNADQPTSFLALGTMPV